MSTCHFPAPRAPYDCDGCGRRTRRRGTESGGDGSRDRRCRPSSAGVSDAFGNALSGSLQSIGGRRRRRSSTSTYILRRQHRLHRGDQPRPTASTSSPSRPAPTPSSTRTRPTSRRAGDHRRAAARRWRWAPWAVDQPYLVGTVTNAAGQAAQRARIDVYDATDRDSVSITSGYAATRRARSRSRRSPRRSRSASLGQRLRLPSTSTTRAPSRTADAITGPRPEGQPRQRRADRRWRDHRSGHQ